MGSTGINTNRSFSEVLKDEINTEGYQILKSHMEVFPPYDDELESAIAYCAVRHPDRHVFGLVVTFTRVSRPEVHCKEEVIYKLVDESMGPCYYNCPMDIIKLLSPIPDDQTHIWANRWRSKCRANATANN